MRRTRIGGIITALTACLLLAACADAALAPGQDAALRAVFTELRQGRVAQVEARFDPSYARPDLDRALSGLARVIPKAPPQRVRLLSARSLSTSAGESFRGVYEYTYPDRLLVVRTGIVAPRGGAAQISTFFIDVTPMSAVRANAFTLIGKSPAQYAFLAAVCAAPLIILIALISLARSFRVRAKLTWAIGIIAGVGAVTMNWTSGDIGVRPWFADIFGVWVMHADTPASPWMITASSPLVALIYLGLRLFGWPRAKRTLPTGLDLADPA